MTGPARSLCVPKRFSQLVDFHISEPTTFNECIHKFYNKLPKFVDALLPSILDGSVVCVPHTDNNNRSFVWMDAVMVRSTSDAPIVLRLLESEDAEVRLQAAKDILAERQHKRRREEHQWILEEEESRRLTLSTGLLNRGMHARTSSASPSPLCIGSSPPCDGTVTSNAPTSPSPEPISVDSPVPQCTGPRCDAHRTRRDHPWLTLNEGPSLPHLTVVDEVLFCDESQTQSQSVALPPLTSPTANRPLLAPCDKELPLFCQNAKRGQWIINVSCHVFMLWQRRSTALPQLERQARIAFDDIHQAWETHIVPELRETTPTDTPVFKVQRIRSRGHTVRRIMARRDVACHDKVMSVINRLTSVLLNTTPMEQ